jgi:DNA modification methylase
MQNQIVMEMVAIGTLSIIEPVLRVHPPAKLRKLTRHVKKFGVLAPLLVDGAGVIVDGVARFEAAKAADVTHLNVISVAHLTRTEIRSLRLALNRLQEEVKWDPNTVAAELNHLIEVGFDLDLTGFDAVEIDGILQIGDTPADVEDLDTTLAEGPTVSQGSDIWVLQTGTQSHRVACGDFRDGALRDQLLRGRRAAVCFADPPYNVAIAGHVSSSGKHAEFAMASGEMTDEQFEAFLGAMFEALESILEVVAVSYVCMDWRHLRHLLTAAEARRLELVNLAVWVKSNAGMGSFYRSQHELIAGLKRRGERHRNNIELGRHGRSRSNVWQYRGVNVHGPERHLLDDHPTVKPSAMVADAIRDVTLPGELVFDPFLGSGTTLLAAQRTGRICFGIEIAPRYVDLTIRRWQHETGRSAVREADGMTFADAEEQVRRKILSNGEAL